VFGKVVSGRVWFGGVWVSLGPLLSPFSPSRFCFPSVLSKLLYKWLKTKGLYTVSYPYLPYHIENKGFIMDTVLATYLPLTPPLNSSPEPAWLVS
jgi:hypothetical protein